MITYNSKGLKCIKITDNKIITDIKNLHLKAKDFINYLLHNSNNAITTTTTNKTINTLCINDLLLNNKKIKSIEIDTTQFEIFIKA